MIRIKLHSLESYYRRKIMQLRDLEIWNTKICQFLSTLQYFFFFTGPLLASYMVITIYNILHEESLDVLKCYLIIVIVGNMQSPLLTLSNALNES